MKGNKEFNIRGTGTIGKGSSVSPLVLIDGMEGCLLYTSVNYLEQAGQPYPIFMRQDSLTVKFTLKEPAKNARLYYLTTGHGGWPGALSVRAALWRQAITPFLETSG